MPTPGIRNEKKIKQRIVRKAEELQTRLGLDYWRIHHKFNTGLVEGDERVCATTEADWEYSQAKIIWQVSIVALLTDEELEMTILHEFVHILNAPIWNSLSETKRSNAKLAKLNEFATENMARALFAALSVTEEVDS